MQLKCIIIDDDAISRKMLEAYIQKNDFLQLVESFNNPIKSLNYLRENNVDLIFLDIEMPEMNGIEFLKAIQQSMPQVILTSSHKEFALEAFDYNVTDYLVKPIEYSRFYKAITKTYGKSESQLSPLNANDTIFVKKGTSIVRINKSDIQWIEALGDYVTINTKSGKVIMHSTMNSMEKKLSINDFLRVHRSFIVRIDKIDSIEDQAIAIHEKLIPIGKNYKEEVMKRFKSF